MINSGQTTTTELDVAFSDSLIIEQESIIGAPLTAQSYAEIIANDAIEVVPILREVNAARKFIGDIHAINLMKQTEAFIRGANLGSLNEEKRKKYQKRLQEDSFFNKELRRILVILDTQDDEEKSFLLGNCFRAYALGEIDWDSFRELTEFVKRLFPGDIQLLQRIHDGEREIEATVLYRYQRLEGIGGVVFPGSTYRNLAGKGPYNAELSPLGERFCEITGRSELSYTLDLYRATKG